MYVNIPILGVSAIKDASSEDSFNRGIWAKFRQQNRCRSITGDYRKCECILHGQFDMGMYDTGKLLLDLHEDRE